MARARKPGLKEERSLFRRGYQYIAGLDEVGRGSWAGPVAAAAVVLPLERADLRERLEGVRDSKLLTPRRRELLYVEIREVALAIGVGVVEPALIDQMGIVETTRLAMRRALQRLSLEPQYLLIDFLSLHYGSVPHKAIPGGDNRSLSIACASIVAKVERDALMTELEADYPDYGFARHKGYGTRQHREALYRWGLTPWHRLSFAPMRFMVKR